jgi:hypothetical protein
MEQPMIAALLLMLAVALGVSTIEAKPAAPAPTPSQPTEPTCHIDIPEI